MIVDDLVRVRIYYALKGLAIVLIYLAVPQYKTSPGSPASIQNLSSEILSRIFLHSLTSHEITIASRPPLLLCHVCSKWRKIALNIPRLWCSLYIKPSTRYLSRDTVEGRLIRLVRFYMDNAKDCPMSLHLSLTRAGSWAPESENNWSNLFNELLGLRFLNRYHDISIYAPEFEFNQLGRFSLYFPGHVHRLRSVKLRARSASSSDIISLFSFAPQLSRVIFGLQDGYVMDDSWSIISQHFRPALLPLPWGQLTHFCITMSITLPVWYALLPQLHSLEQCVITLDADGYGESRTIKLSETPTVLPNLTVLSLALIARDRPAVFHGTDMPQLKKLQLSSLFPMNIMTIQWQEHIDVLRNLSSFSLHRVGIDSPHLINVLRAMDQLEELTLSCDLRDYNMILEALTIDEATVVPLAPSLQKLRIHVAFNRNANAQFTPEILARMIQSRWWIPLTSIPVKRLYFVRLGVFGGDQSLMELRILLMPMIHEGLMFEVLHEPTPFPYPDDEDITLIW